MRRGTVICVVCAAVLLGSCGNTKSSKLGYEVPVATARAALNYSDADAYLNCWLPQEKALFTSNEEYLRWDITSVFDRSEHLSRLQLKLGDCTELEDEDIEALEQEARARYGTRLEFTKAEKIRAEFRVHEGDKIMSASKDLTAVRYENEWYIFGEIMTEISFAGS